MEGGRVWDGKGEALGPQTVRWDGCRVRPTSSPLTDEYISLGALIGLFQQLRESW